MLSVLEMLSVRVPPCTVMLPMPGALLLVRVSEPEETVTLPRFVMLFGPMLTVKAHPDSLVALAQLGEVQRIEYARGRTLLNDLSRVRMGVSGDTMTNGNYLGLSGTNVMLNINDTGVDATHPDLAGRVLSDVPTSAVDSNGHGTHSAGIIAGSGASSAGQYAGMAPGVNLISIKIAGALDKITRQGRRSLP